MKKNPISRILAAALSVLTVSSFSAAVFADTEAADMISSVETAEITGAYTEKAARISGNVAVGYYDSNGSFVRLYTGDIIPASCTSILINVNIDDYINHALYVNGQEVTLTQNGDGYCFYANIAPYAYSTTVLDFTLSEKAWSSNRLSSYVRMYKDSGINVYHYNKYNGTCVTRYNVPNGGYFNKNEAIVIRIPASSYPNARYIYINGTKYECSLNYDNQWQVWAYEIPDNSSTLTIRFANSNSGLSTPVIQGAANVDTGIALTWSEVVGATSYKVYRADSSTGAKILLKTVGTNSTIDTTAISGMGYYYYIQAYNSSTNSSSALSSGIYIQRNNSGNTDGPVILSATSVPTGIQITWDKVRGATSYLLYRADSINGIKTHIKTVATTSTIDTTADVGKTYYYFIKSYNSVAKVCSSYSEGFAAKRTSTSTVAAPRITGTTAISTGIEVRWTAVSGATSYRLYRADSTTGTRTHIKTVGNTYTVDTSAVYGRKYYYFVVAYNSKIAVSSAYSGGAYCTMIGLKKPVLTSSNLTSGAALRWSATPGATSYRVYRASSATGAMKLIKAVGGTSFTDTTASSGTTYYYYVVAYNSSTGRTSPASNKVSAHKLAVIY